MPDWEKGSVPMFTDSILAELSFPKQTKQKKAKQKDENLRPDGTKKGAGYFGVMDIPGGGTTSEYSFGVPLFGKETDIPSLVPTLTKEELELMVKDIIPNGKPIPDSIANKAIEHAEARILKGMSPFND